MKEVDLTEAGRDFFTLIDEVENGASVLVKRDGRPAVKLVPVQSKSPEADGERQA